MSPSFSSVSQDLAFVVEGTSPGIDGEYTQVGTAYGKPKYARMGIDRTPIQGDKQVIIRWAGEGTVGFGESLFAWIVNLRDSVALHAVGDGVTYFHEQDTSTPPVDGWTAIKGDPESIRIRHPASHEACTTGSNRCDVINEGVATAASGC